MPEGHILHRLAREFTDKLAGRSLESTSPQGRFAQAEELNGLVAGRSWARGKHLFVPFENHSAQVHVHLGLYGAFTLTDSDSLPVVGQVRWRLERPGLTIDLRGPTRCELLVESQIDSILDRLGPDPLDPQADPERAWHRVARSSQSIGQLLMDQSVISGVGNVYRAEVLFRHQINPFVVGKELSRTAFDAIWIDLVELMELGAQRGRIDTVRPEHEPDAMGRPPRQDDHGGEVYVYRRHGQPCFVCNNSVLSEVLASRNVFWCPDCQSAD